MEKDKTHLEPEEVGLLERAATNLRDCLLVRVTSNSGCRISEVLGLRVEDIDFEQGMVAIEHLKARLKLTCPHCSARLGRSHTFCPKCGAKVEEAVAESQEHRRLRTLHLDGDTQLMVRDYIERGGPVLRHGTQVLFGINRHHAWKIVRDAAERANLGWLVNPETGTKRGVSPHRLRDAFAVIAVQQDDSTDSIRMLQEWLGHANIGTTMRYRKVAGQELKDWYQKLWDKAESGSD